MHPCFASVCILRISSHVRIEGVGEGVHLSYATNQYQIQFTKNAPLMPQYKFEDTQYMCIMAKHVNE